MQCSSTLYTIKYPKTGILTLIPQKDKDRTFLKHLRPLTILGTDYKMITTLLVILISSILRSIISNDQSTYLKVGYIGENIRTITDIISYCKTKNMSAGLLLIDFEKAFNTVKWSFLDEILNLFYLGDIFRKWVRIICGNVTHQYKIRKKH